MVKLKKLLLPSVWHLRLEKNVLIYIFFPLHFRMLNILLPAYSRNYTALRASGLMAEADEMENHELENLVLRERAVVWADQEGHQPEGDRSKEEPRDKNDAGNAGLRSELAPVLSFSHLLYHASSPCSKSSYLHLILIISISLIAHQLLHFIHTVDYTLYVYD